MDKYIWLLVVIFIFHDMEEIIGIKGWISKNYDDIISKYPKATKILNTYKGISTEAFALAVYEELILLISICIITTITSAPILQGIWFGVLIGFTAHLFIHLIQAGLIRKYIPALITSIISIPSSIWLIVRCYSLLQMSPLLIFGILLGIIGVAVNLKVAHLIMFRYQSLNYKPAQRKKD